MKDNSFQKEYFLFSEVNNIELKLRTKHLECAHMIRQRSPDFREASFYFLISPCSHYQGWTHPIDLEWGGQRLI